MRLFIVGVRGIEWSRGVASLRTGTGACTAKESTGLWLGVAETGERMVGGLGVLGGRGEAEGRW